MMVREISNSIEPKVVIEGAGVRLRRSISPKRSNVYDPFLLFDHFIFQDPIEGPIAGFPYHPHRGIETVTYMLAGSTYHRDSLGNSGLIGPGDVQWMTSGRGILHEEMPRRDIEGRVNGFQLWVNLPSAKKMVEPRYQEVVSASIPEVVVDGVTARVISGKIGDTKGPIEGMYAGVVYVDLSLEPEARFRETISSDHTVMAYVYEGECEFGSRESVVRSVSMVILGMGDGVEVYSRSGTRLMLVCGKPFGEPIAPYGPFVMNTKAEIEQALRDLREGTFVETVVS